MVEGTPCKELFQTIVFYGIFIGFYSKEIPYRSRPSIAGLFLTLLFSLLIKLQFD